MTIHDFYNKTELTEWHRPGGSETKENYLSLLSQEILAINYISWCHLVSVSHEPQAFHFSFNSSLVLPLWYTFQSVMFLLK